MVGKFSEDKVFENNIDNLNSVANETANGFEKIGISNDILSAIDEIGFSNPTDIQSSAIPILMSGKDLIGISKTGSGKTAAFVIPIIEKIEKFSNKIEALILCPTRELAMQILNEIKKFSKYKRGIRSIALYGGQSIDRQITFLSTPKNLVVGTPGRVIDLINRKIINFNDVKTIVLDEADEMLNMGFRQDIGKILSTTSQKRQTVLFSATMSKEITDIAKEFQTKPETIKSKSDSLTVSTIEQYFIDIPLNYDRIDVLCYYLDLYNSNLSLVFCNTKKDVEELSIEVANRGFSACSLHGDMKQYERNRVLSEFKEGKTKILIATDVVARGIDVDGIEVVFNYEVPQNEEYYVHRIGRTGRAGRKGSAYTLVSGKKQFLSLKSIENYIKKRINKETIPSIKDIYEKKQERIMKGIRYAIKNLDLTDYKKIIEVLTSEGFEPIDVAASLLKMNYKELEKEKTGGTKNFSQKDVVKFKLDLGKKNEITASHILGAISVKTGIPGKNIGKITIFDKHSFFEVSENFIDKVNSASNFKIKGLYTKISLVGQGQK